MRATDIDEEDAEDSLVELLDSLGVVESVSVPHWAIFLVAGIIIIFFPRIRRQRE